MLNGKFAVTTARNAGGRLYDVAKEWAKELGVPFVLRSRNQTLDELLEANNVDAFIIALVMNMFQY